MKLIAPGQRRGNKFYLIRGIAAGRYIEISTRTTDLGEAQRFSESFVQQATNTWSPTTSTLTTHISVLLTKAFDDVRRAAMRPECGVYFLLRGRNVEYVGQSHRTSKRIKHHREEKRILFDSWVAVACAPHELDLLEAAYIYHFRPPFNRGVSRGVPQTTAKRAPHLMLIQNRRGRGGESA